MRVVAIFLTPLRTTLLAITFVGCHPVPTAVTSNTNDNESATFAELYVPDEPTTTTADGKTVAKSGRCAPDAIKTPVDIAPQTLPFPCMSIPITEIATLINRTTEQLAKTDFTVLLTKECLQVAMPSGLDFVIAAAISKDETGADYAKDFRLPLPTEISGLDGIENMLGGIDLPNSIQFPSYTLPEDKALLVAKLTSYNGELFLKLVNIAGITTENGRQFISTLGDEARQHMSASMKIDGPGIYAIFFASKAIGFVSGRVLQSDQPVAGAIVTGSGSPFLSRTDDSGAYSIANFQGQAGLAAYDINTYARGELFFNIEGDGNTNPKTGKAPETPATQTELPSLTKTLNLRNVNIKITAAGATEANTTNLNFESGDFTAWNTTGNADTLDSEMATLFPNSNESVYAFISTGQGSVDDVRSSIVRTIVVPTGTTKMHIDYNFLSQEYPKWVDSPYNDMFYVLTAGASQFLHSETVRGNKGSWQPFTNVVGNMSESSATADPNTRAGGMTGARRKTVDVSHCAGGKAVFVFGVADVGDRIYDTAAIIDAISFE